MFACLSIILYLFSYDVVISFLKGDKMGNNEKCSTKCEALNIGDKLYKGDEPDRPFEVFKITNSHYYLAICSGCVSKIDYITKNNLEEEIGKHWFRTTKEVLQAHNNRMIRLIEFNHSKMLEIEAEDDYVIEKNITMRKDEA